MVKMKIASNVTIDFARDRKRTIELYAVGDVYELCITDGKIHGNGRPYHNRYMRDEQKAKRLFEVLSGKAGHAYQYID